MNQFDFSLLANYYCDITEDIICDLNDDLIDAAGDDFIMTAIGNSLVIDFYRAAASYESAIVSAIKQIKSVKGISVKSVDAGQYVSLSDAATLANLHRSALSKYRAGTRVKGQPFPSAYMRGKSKTPLYDWAEVAQWLEDNNIIEAGLAEQAKTTSLVNAALKYHQSDLQHISILEKEFRQSSVMYAC